MPGFYRLARGETAPAGMMLGGPAAPTDPPTPVRLAAFLLVNAGLLAAWSWWLARVHGERGAANAAYAGLLFASQLVATGLALGAAGALRLPAVLAALGTVAAAVVAHAALRGRPPAPARAPWRELAAPAGLALAALAAAFCAWLLAAAWLLPPRGVDDLAYHLPPVYQYVQTGRIALLPLELRTQFAMPLGGDFLYLWPALFFGADTWVDAVGLGVALYGCAVLYALACALGAGRRDALVAALAFLLMPVVMAQAGASYTDLAIAACHLALLYAAVRAWRDGGALHVAMAGLAAGFGLGVKYNMLVAVAAALPVLALGAWRRGGAAALARAAGTFTLALVPLPAYWYVRNALVTGEPLYPYALGPGGLRPLGTMPEEAVLAEGAVAAGRALPALFAEPARLLGFLFRDPGLGTLNGGFGLVAWGLGLPALAWCLARAAREARRGDWLPLLLWGTAPVVFLLFLQQTDLTRLQFNMRLALVAPALGLAALAVALGRVRADWPGAAAALRGAVVGASALALAHLAGARIPTFDVSAAAADRRAGTVTTPQRYYRGSEGDLPGLATAFEPLDFLTLGGPGWSVYMAADWRVFMTAPLFGSGLQNRVWNFQAEPRRAPDALVFHAGFGGGGRRLYYVRGTLTPAEVARDPAYALLARSGPTELWVSAARLAEPATRARLAALYERREAADIAAFRAVAAALPPADAVVGSLPVLNALRYLELTGALAVPVHLARAGDEAALARRLGAARVITLGAPLAGAASRPLATVRTSQGTVGLHFNELAP
jgi:hypothetical protein